MRHVPDSSAIPFSEAGYVHMWDRVAAEWREQLTRHLRGASSALWAAASIASQRGEQARANDLLDILAMVVDLRRVFRDTAGRR